MAVGDHGIIVWAERYTIIRLTCSLTFLLSSSMFLILKSMPIVVINVGENESFA